MVLLLKTVTTTTTKKVKEKPSVKGNAVTHYRATIQGSPSTPSSGIVYLFAVLLLLNIFLIIFFVSIKRGWVNTVQTLCPFPVEGSELLFAAKRNRC